MIKTARSLFTARAAVCCLALFLCSVSAQAATIVYGNFGPVPPGVSFLGVTESSGTDAVPLYGPPTPFSIGLDFNPTGFVASATGGASDITDGQLNFTILANPAGITTVGLFEAGDYTLAGLGTPATSVFAGSNIRVNVTQLNGVNIAPVALIPANASVGFALPPNQISLPWSLGTSVNVGAQVAALFGANAVATRVDVVLNNTLLAFSEPSSIAFIAKKDFIINVGTNNVPEPGTFALLAMALPLGLGLARRRG